MKNIVLKSEINEPIYYTNVLIIVAHDACKAFWDTKRFTSSKKNDHFTSLTAWQGNHFGMFFHVDSIGSETIAHEIKHLVDYVMESIGAKPARKRISKKIKEALTEPEAYLTGYFHKRLYALLRRHKIRLKN